MLILNLLLLLLLLLLPLLPASISAAAVDRIVYTPGHNADTSNTSSNLQRRDEITWGPDDETQDACDSDEAPEETEGSEFLKLDCMEILKFNQRFGRYTISGYTDGKWAKINVKDTCCVAVARKDGATNDFEVGDMDIRDVINTAMGLYSDPFKMKSVTGAATCDAADTSGNDVPIKWKVVDPDDLG
ncbi:hypothetical protein LA080_004876 [Diaporthe eres]|uniref:Ecp2 effector protein-like domain-containing protein n=1 Tax=Diaporthe vaccinii TaxID=105482 RepID=A0ABR4EHL7_9PEZI|nr:hypothetical protein LA080_004876 [Diaporthe eres]